MPGEGLPISRMGSGLATVGHAELGQHGGDVVVHRTWRDHQTRGDVGVAEALAHQVEHLLLTSGQPVRVLPRRGPGADGDAAGAEVTEPLAGHRGCGGRAEGVEPLERITQVLLILGAEQRDRRVVRRPELVPQPCGFARVAAQLRLRGGLTSVGRSPATRHRWSV